MNEWMNEWISIILTDKKHPYINKVKSSSLSVLKALEVIQDYKKMVLTKSQEISKTSDISHGPYLKICLNRKADRIPVTYLSLQTGFL